MVLLKGNDLVGKRALVIYKESGRELQCFGQILGHDSSFFTVKTEENTLLIPNQSIQKVKLRNDEFESNVIKGGGK